MREQIDASWPKTYTTLMQAYWEEDIMQRYSTQQILTTVKEVKQIMSSNSSQEVHNSSQPEDDNRKLKF